MAKGLVIDDEEGLRRKGYDLVLADGGRKGLELFRRERPDVVVLDLKMPEMDGMAAVQQVRRLTAEQPVIILKGAGMPEKAQQATTMPGEVSQEQLTK